MAHRACTKPQFNPQNPINYAQRHMPVILALGEVEAEEPGFQAILTTW